LNAFSIEVLIGRLIGLVIGFTLHEFAHAWTAHRLGDNTAYYQGRLTVNPRSHIEPMGLFFALIAGFGWARPVPINPRAFYPNEKRGLIIVSLAGPLMNLIIAAVVSLLIHGMLAANMIEVGRFGGLYVDSRFAATLYRIIETVIIFNLIMFLFNLLPFSPLDGYKIALGLLPPEQSATLVRYERETTLALMLLLMLGVMSWGRFNPLWAVLGPPLRFLFKLFTSIPY
jgi:Zn-dependent protease